MEEIIKAIQDLFIIRNDCYPKQIEGENKYIVVKEDLTSEIIQKHLSGVITIGCFQINPQNNKVKWICFDFDGDLEQEFEKAKHLVIKLKEEDLNPLLEFSGRRGYHIWLFIEPTDAVIARKFALEVSENINPHEIFPKQDKLENDRKYGCQVKLPVGIHKVSNKWSYFFDKNLKQLFKEESKNLLIKINDKERDIIQINSLKEFIL